VTTREPGASEVLMWGWTFRPASTAFFASSPAASSTLGLLVLVQDVIAAMSTSPLPIVTRPLPGRTGVAGAWAWAAASVARLSTISTTSRAAPGATGGVAGTAGG